MRLQSVAVRRAGEDENRLHLSVKAGCLHHCGLYDLAVALGSSEETSCRVLGDVS